MQKTIISAALLGALSLTSLTAFAQTTAVATTTATTTKAAKGTKKVDPVCLQNAIEKRDTALITGLSMQNTTITNALTARKDAVKAAFMLPTRAEVVTARKAANAAFEKSAKTARTTMKSSRTNAWSTYKTDAKACGQAAEQLDQPTVTESSL